MSTQPPRPSSSPGQQPHGDCYSFGDNSTAERRLRLLADVFAPTSEALLARLDADTTGRVIDLGCGPGLTTRMLARHFRGVHVVGLDSSPAFVAGAGGGGGGGGGGVSFLEHDVRALPLPGAPAAMIYARFLLAHLQRATDVVGAWAGELAPGGVLVLEEVEWIQTADSVLSIYLELMAGVLRAHQTELYIGPALGRLEVPAGCSAIHNDVARLAPTTAEAAALFSLNLATVRHDAAIATQRTEAELDSLAGALEARCNDEQVGSITWGMRQVIVRRS